MKNVELLAPAGNFECLKAAVNNGANAVYLGSKNFSARAFAGNFDHDELIEAVRYAHLHDVRVFVTINTLLNEKEFDNAVKLAEQCYKCDVDALLIQDLGLFYELKKRYPDFELHCSTQMHVHNLEGVRTAKRLGFKRVVLARESDLSLIRQACKEGIEIETFVHGALCVSYSGQCLMSSATKKRSANKGMCAQCCRLRYELLDSDSKKVKTDTDYLLSPKDMFLLNDIPSLIDSGVSSFKIEGRMKSPAYVGYVTSLYRKAIDAHLEGRVFSIDEEQFSNLKVLFNRNFTNDLLYDRNDLFGQKTPNHLGIEIGKVIDHKKNLTYIRLNRELNQFDGIRIGDEGFIVNRLYVNDLLVSTAKEGQVCAVECEKRVYGIVFKTQDHLLEKKILEATEKKVALDLEVFLYPHNKVRTILKHNEQIFEYISDIEAQEALKTPLNEDSVTKQFSRLNDTVYYPEKISVHTDNAFLPVSMLNRIRREAIEAFDEYRIASFKRSPMPCVFSQIEVRNDHDGAMLQENDTIIMDDKVFPINYVINPDSEYILNDRAVICEFGGLMKDYKEKIAYYTLNCCNSHTYEFLQRMGFQYIVLSSELHKNEISDLIDSYEKRFERKIRPYVFMKGDRVLMYIKSDPFGKYLISEKGYSLSDGNNIYKIKKHGDITELIEEGHTCDTGDLDVLPLTVKL